MNIGRGTKTPYKYLPQVHTFLRLGIRKYKNLLLMDYKLYLVCNPLEVDFYIFIYTVKSRKYHDLYYTSNLKITGGNMQKTYNAI